jgi:hypothetical protein
LIGNKDNKKSKKVSRVLPFDMNKDGWLLLDDSTLYALSYDKEDKNYINYLLLEFDKVGGEENLLNETFVLH